MRIGLTFDEYIKLKLEAALDGIGYLKCEPGRPPVFEPLPQDDEPPQSQLFPMTTAQAASHLRSRGYDCRPQMLELLVENGVVRLSQPDRWTQSDVEAAADYFEDAEIYTPYAAMCQALGCGYADFLRALREAAQRESARYGRRVPADDQYFVMHRVPPRDDKPSVISFTLCDDVRERLERGGEV